MKFVMPLYPLSGVAKYSSQKYISQSKVPRPLNANFFFVLQASAGKSSLFKVLNRTKLQ